jgi:cytochrome b6-f complex iron-sulfur subunit
MAVKNEIIDSQDVKAVSLTRQAFLKLSLLISGVFTSLGIIKFLSYQQPAENPTKLILQEYTTYPPGSVTPVPLLKAWILHDEAGLYALSAVCSHLGCTVGETNSGFECPCHAARARAQTAGIPSTQPVRRFKGRAR